MLLRAVSRARLDSKLAVLLLLCEVSLAVLLLLLSMLLLLLLGPLSLLLPQLRLALALHHRGRRAREAQLPCLAGGTALIALQGRIELAVEYAHLRERLEQRDATEGGRDRVSGELERAQLAQTTQGLQIGRRCQ